MSVSGLTHPSYVTQVVSCDTYVAPGAPLTVIGSGSGPGPQPGGALTGTNLTLTANPASIVFPGVGGILGYSIEGTNLVGISSVNVALVGPNIFIDGPVEFTSSITMSNNERITAGFGSISSMTISSINGGIYPPPGAGGSPNGAFSTIAINATGNIGVSTLSAVAITNVSTINGVAPGGGGSYPANPQFSTIHIPLDDGVTVGSRLYFGNDIIFGGESSLEGNFMIIKSPVGLGVLDSSGERGQIIGGSIETYALSVSSINGVAPGGGGAYTPNAMFSTIAMNATGNISVSTLTNVNSINTIPVGTLETTGLTTGISQVITGYGAQNGVLINSAVSNGVGGLGNVVLQSQYGKVSTTTVNGNIEMTAGAANSQTGNIILNAALGTIGLYTTLGEIVAESQATGGRFYASAFDNTGIICSLQIGGAPNSIGLYIGHNTLTYNGASLL